MIYRTSLTHPLRIDSVDYPGSDGRIGITLCPGKVQPDGHSGAWCRNLALDLDWIQTWGASHVLTLIEQRELARLRVQRLPEAVRDRGLQWIHLPVTDRHPPDHRFRLHWPSIAPALHETLANDGRIVVHCMGGQGRAGTLAAVILHEAGIPMEEAIARVREARRGAIETEAQAEWLEHYPTRQREAC